ncbi:TetR-like C-terminal domain-containing protein [Streptomyces sp. NPDC051105]|uniref:TetR-like C-terminal domain-containing protein n=1 Tax=Streptomyces sp. NPDC051105 TaxID=3154843 RepID=UPI00343B7B1D
MAASLPALAAGLLPHTELMARFRETFLRRKRQNIDLVLRRGMARGDLPPDLDTELVQDLWAGAVLYRRLMIGSPLDDDLAERLIELVTHVPGLSCPGQVAQADEAGGRRTGRRVLVRDHHPPRQPVKKRRRRETV